MRGSGSPSQRNRESWAWRGSCSSHPSSEGSAGSGSTQREGCPATQDPEQVTARQSDALASPAPQPPSTFSLPLLTALGRSRPEAGAREIGKCSLWKMILQRWAEGRRGPALSSHGCAAQICPLSQCCMGLLHTGQACVNELGKLAGAGLVILFPQSDCHPRALRAD